MEFICTIFSFHDLLIQFLLVHTCTYSPYKVTLSCQMSIRSYYTLVKSTFDQSRNPGQCGSTSIEKWCHEVCGEYFSNGYSWIKKSIWP